MQNKSNELHFILLLAIFHITVWNPCGVWSITRHMQIVKCFQLQEILTQQGKHFPFRQISSVLFSLKLTWYFWKNILAMQRKINQFSITYCSKWEHYSFCIQVHLLCFFLNLFCFTTALVLTSSNYCQILCPSKFSFLGAFQRPTIAIISIRYWRLLMPNIFCKKSNPIKYFLFQPQ